MFGIFHDYISEFGIMTYKNKMLWYILLLNFALCECLSDFPCVQKTTEYGFVCVCNETYCDTINRPHPKKGIFIHYMTSEQSPGFTKTTGEINYGMYEQLPNNGSSDVYIQVTDTVQYQSINGVGASITDSSGVAINSLGPGAQKNFFESCFGVKGVEYSFIRMPVAASDFSVEYYTYDDVPGDVDLKNFYLNDVDYTIKIPFIQKAMNVSKRGIKLLGTPWSAPNWMKINNITRAGYLYSKYLSVWSNYLLKFLKSYSDEGVEFWGLTQGNEVILPVFFGSFFPIQNTVLLPNQARELSKYMGTIIKSVFKDLKVFMLDDERPFMTWYSDRVFADDEANQCVDGIALHWYFDTQSSLSRLTKFHEDYPNKYILYSESSINGFQSSGGSVNLGDWSRATRYIENVMENLSNWVNGYIDWNIALNTVGGPPDLTNMTLEAQLIINMTNGEFYKQPIFYVLGHFSKFIFNEAIRINTTIQQDTPDINEDNLSMRSLIDIMKTRLFNIANFIIAAQTTRAPGTPPPPPTSTSGTTPPPHTSTSGTTPPQPTGTPCTTTPQPTGTPGTPPTGGPQPGPGPTGGPHPGPFPTSTPLSNRVSALAVKNPDGSRTLIVYNPKSEQLNVTVADSELGTFRATIDPKSINSFCYK